MNIYNLISEDNHIIQKPSVLLDYLLCINMNGKERKKAITFKVKDTANKDSITFLNSNYWIRTVELSVIINAFKDVDIKGITNFKMGYIAGLISPFMPSYPKNKIFTVANHYEVYFRLEYNNTYDGSYTNFLKIGEEVHVADPSPLYTNKDKMNFVSPEEKRSWNGQ